MSGHGERLSSCLGDLRNNGVTCFGLASRHDDRSALRREAKGNRAADTATTACDDRDLVVELE